MKHSISTKWLANLKKGLSHFPHDFWRLYEYLMNNQTEDSQVGGLTYLPLWKNVSNYLQDLLSLNSLHSSSFPLLQFVKILHKIRTHSFAKSTYFHHFLVFLSQKVAYLNCTHVFSIQISYFAYKRTQNG